MKHWINENGNLIRKYKGRTYWCYCHLSPSKPSCGPECPLFLATETAVTLNCGTGVRITLEEPED